MQFRYVLNGTKDIVSLKQNTSCLPQFQEKINFQDEVFSKASLSPTVFATLLVPSPPRTSAIKC